VCLAVPGRIVELWEEAGLRLAQVDFGGVRRTVCLETLPGAGAGAWVLVHAGVALQTLDAEAAAESLRVLAAGLALEDP
jgi:hydrogenase expression/formation protein HypC